DLADERRTALDGAGVMATDHLRERRQALSREGGEPVREAGVEARPLGPGQTGVASIAKQRMTEHVTRPQNWIVDGVTDQGAEDECGNRLGGLLGRKGFEGGEREPAAGDRRTAGGRASGRRQIVELAG